MASTGCKIIVSVCVLILACFAIYYVLHNKTSVQTNSQGGVDQDGGSQGGDDQDRGGQAGDIDTTKLAYTITVSKSGDANFTTITDAIDSIPTRNKQWIRIFIQPAVYKEQIKIHEEKSFIVIEGKDRSNTIITYDAHDTTTESSTFAVYADNFVAKGITFKNSVDKVHVSAVAFRTSGDKHAYYSCGFEGYQDTLWDDQGRHYFHSCYIEGAVDFIWGSGQSLYDKCRVNVIGDGFITAQGRKSSKDSNGFVFRDCDIYGSGDVYLGRAYGPFAKVIFIRSSFSDVIDSKGWFIWHQNDHKEDITFVEYDCKGPGADTSKRVSWITTFTSSEIEKYDGEIYIDDDGWITKLP